MGRPLGLFSVLLSFFLALTACVSEEERDASPALWKISDRNGYHGYVFGSIHSLPNGINWQTTKIRDAIADSGELVLEIDDVADSAALQRIFQAMGRTPGLPSLNDRLPRDRWDAADELAKDASLTPAMIAQTESWALALILASQSTSDAGADSDNGVDVILQQVFEDTKRPISGLETAESQFAAFDSLDEQSQRLMLDAAIAGAQTADTDYANLVRRWSEGDLNGLAAITDDQMLTDNPAIRANLLVERNRRWAAQIAPLVEKGKTPFISVGAGHLVGQDSLLSMLEADGIKVKRIQ